jgi:trigger factor
LVKLSVEVEESEFDRDIDAAFRKIAREVKLPGFRSGKAPRRVLEARIGLGPAREQALRDAIPQYLASAVREHEVDLIAAPEVEITRGEDTGAVAFDATCEVRPEVSVPGYGGLRVEVPSPDATDEEVDEAITNELRRHGQLVDVDRPAQTTDQVTLTLSAHRDGEPVPGLNTEDWVYEIGRGWVAAGFDDHLVGASAGDRLTFSAVPNGNEDPADFEVTVGKVQELVLPELTDEWVDENTGEHDTVEALRAALAERISGAKLGQARNLVVERATTALADLVDVDPPEAMVNNDLQSRVQRTVQQFQAQGIALEQWLQATGQDPASFVESLRVQSAKAVKVDLALRAVAAAEDLTAGDDEIDAELEAIAARAGQKPAQVRKVYERNDALADLAAQLRMRKALDWVLEHLEIVDPEGNAIDGELLLGKTDDRDHAGRDRHDPHFGHDHD